MITMHRQMLGALVRHFNLPQGLLGAAFMDQPADPGYAAQVAQWHSALPEAEKIPLSALKVLAEPALVADVRAFLRRETLIRTWAVCGAAGECPLVLAAASGEDGEQLKLNWRQTREEFADTLLVWLIEAGEPSEPEMKVELSQAEFAVLLALCDLHSRAAYSAYIAHTPVAASYPVAFLQQAFQEAVAVDDPRWLLSFATPLLDEEASKLTADQVGQTVDRLVRRGLIQREGAEIRWTVPGEYLAESFHRRKVTVAIDTAASDRDGLLGTHAGLLLRSDQPLWYADIAGGGPAAVTGVSVQAARDILDAFLTPVGPPPVKRQAPEPPPPAETMWYVAHGGQTEGPMAESVLRSRLATLPPGALVWNAGLPGWVPPAQAGLVAPAPAARACPACGAALSPTQRFCVHCGAPVG